MNWKDCDKDNLFRKVFTLDYNLERRIKMLKEILEEKYRTKLLLVVVQGARTDESNEEYYQKKYGETWRKYYNKNSLHVVRADTGNTLRAADIGFIREDNGQRLTGQEIYRIIQEHYLFGNVGVDELFVHVDTLIRTWVYKV